MIDLWYLNTKNNSPEDLNILLRALPQKISNEILRYRYHEDRRLKFFGKLMVRKYYKEAGLEFDWNNWLVASDGKPYYKGGKKFNISHSGEYVLVAFSDTEIGADIEGVTDFDVVSISTYFHPLEIDYIKNTPEPKDAFFWLWTRKEAYLKAIGKGIIDGLHNENCLSDKMVDKGTWFLHSLSLFPNYQVALCTQIANCKVETRELSLAEFANLTTNSS